MPLTFRFVPPIGGILYWLRPGTMRLPPWPDRVPLTRGIRRTLVDVALYAGVLAAGVYLLLSSGEAVPGTAPVGSTRRAIAVLLGLLGAARPARQGVVPGCAPGGLRLPAGRLPVPDRTT